MPLGLPTLSASDVRAGNMGITVPTPRGVRTKLFGYNALVEPFQMYNLWGITPGIRARLGPADIDLSFPAGQNQPRWQLQCGMQIGQPLQPPQLLYSPTFANNPFSVLGLLGVRLSAWGEKTRAAEYVVPSLRMGTMPQCPDALIVQALEGSCSVGREVSGNLFWGLLEVGVLRSQNMFFAQAVPLSQTMTLVPVSRQIEAAPPAAEALARQGLFAKIWQQMVALWLWTRSALCFGYETMRALVRTKSQAQDDFCAAMGRRIAELKIDGAVAGTNMSRNRTRMILAAPLVRETSRLLPGARAIIRWPALQVRSDRNEEQQVLVLGAKRVPDAQNHIQASLGDGMLWQHNLFEIKHALGIEDRQLVARTKQLPVYLEAELLADRLPKQRILNLEVLIGAPASDPEGHQQALARINEELLSNQGARWRRHLLRGPLSEASVTDACSALVTHLRACLSDKRASVDIKSLRLGVEQTPPKASYRVQSELLQTAQAAGTEPTRLRSEMLIVEPKHNRICRENTLRRSERVALPRFQTECDEDPQPQMVRFDYEVCHRSYPDLDSNGSKDSLNFRFQLLDESLDPRVVNYFLRVIRKKFHWDIFADSFDIEGLAHWLPAYKRRLLFTIDFPMESLMRAHTLMQNFETARKLGIGMLPGIFANTVNGMDMTSPEASELRELMKTPKHELLKALITWFEDLPYEKVLLMLARLWRLGAPTVDSSREATTSFVSDSGLYEDTLERHYSLLRRFEVRKPYHRERKVLHKHADEVAKLNVQLKHERLLDKGIRDALGQRLKRLFADYARILNHSVIENKQPVA